MVANVHDSMSRKSGMAATLHGAMLRKGCMEATALDAMLKKGCWCHSGWRHVAKRLHFGPSQWRHVEEALQCSLIASEHIEEAMHNSYTTCRHVEERVTWQPPCEPSSSRSDEWQPMPLAPFLGGLRGNRSARRQVEEAMHGSPSGWRHFKRSCMTAGLHVSNNAWQPHSMAPCWEGAVWSHAQEGMDVNTTHAWCHGVKSYRHYVTLK